MYTKVDNLEEKEPEIKEKGAKDYSLISMIIAVLWIVSLTLLKGFNLISLDVQGEIIPTGITIAGLFSPVYVSIILDKVKDIRMGGNSKETNSNNNYS